MTPWSPEQIGAAAPDSSSMAAARKLSSPGPWSDTGVNDALLWGRCQGSGKNPYQVSIDLIAPAYRCSCPSRKFPCKHALALLLLWSAGGVTADGTPADFASEWADQRAVRAEVKATRAADPTPADPAAQAKRQAQRIATMDAGVDDFALWLTDLVRSGLAAARGRGYAWWDGTAARLVDAQLPGLADRVRQMGEAVLSRPDWAEHLLTQLGRWWTLVQAWRRRDTLHPDDLADLRTSLGWSLPTAEVRTGPTLLGTWQVLGAHREDSGPLVQQRTWYRAADGEHAGQIVVQYETAGPGQALGVPQLAGAQVHAAAQLYPGSAPQRVLFAEDPAPSSRGTASGFGPTQTIDQALAQASAQLARAPWRDRHPVVLGQVTIVPGNQGPALVLDPARDALPLAEQTPLPRLLAATGGHPCDLFGEWEAGRVNPLAIWDGRQVVNL